MGFLLCQYIGKQDKYFSNYKMSNIENYFLLPNDNLKYMDCNSLDRSNRNKHYQNETRNKKLYVHRKPVQRAASHLYRATTLAYNKNEYICSRCFGPEFVVKASRPSKRLTPFKNNETIVTIILLDGQKLDISCSPSDTTAAQLLRVIIQEEHIEENFMFGLSVLIAGDFIFIPSDVRICKVKDSKTNSNENLTLYLRIRLFLPTLRGMRDQTRHFLYLQLRRSILDHQLRCSYSKIVELTGLALQAEFGNFVELEHGKRDYFLLEHYIPDTMICKTDDVKRLKEELIMAHILRSSLEREQAEQEFIILTQSLPYYGGHFYSAILMLKHNSKKDVWMFISSQGINIYEREKSTSQDVPRIYEMFDWKSIQTLCYTKHYFRILSHSSARDGNKPKKYTLKMDHKKNYFFFRLASLHHQFFLKVRIGYTSLDPLSQQFGIPVENIPSEKELVSEVDVYRKSMNSEIDVNNISENFYLEWKAQEEHRCRKIKSAPDLTEVVDEPIQNESEGSNIPLFFGLPVLSPEKKKGVRMGTRAFPKTETHPVDQHYVKQISLESLSLHCSSTSTSNISLDALRFSSEGDAYVLDSVPQQNFLPNFEETINGTLLERLNGMSFAEERNLLAVMIERDSNGSLGLQITEGSDGNVYVQSIIIGGSAYRNKGILKGDQVVAVNGQSLLGRRYSESLKILKNATGKVQLIISRLIATYASQSVENSFERNINSTQENAFNLNSLDLMKPKDVNLSKSMCSDTRLSSSLLSENQTEGNLTAQSKFIKDLSSNVPESSKKLPTDHSKPIIMDMILRKELCCLKYPLDNSTIIDCDLPKVTKAGNSLISNSTNVITTEDDGETTDSKKEQTIALPRSLGLGRKWKGPVRYPVTPIKKVSMADDEDVSTSDEDQVFL